MLKISNYALTLALLAHSGRVSAECDGVIATFTGECTYSAFEAAFIGGDCDINTLFVNASVAENTVTDLCDYDAPLQFVEIQGTYQKDRRYFSGGGPLVDGGDWDLDTANIQRFETNRGSSTLISWPEYLARLKYNADNELGENGYPANMNLETSCQLNTAVCCFTDDTELGTSFDPATTTDVCRHDLANSPKSNHITNGWSVFPDSETSTQCVGFTWKDGEDELIGNMMYDVSLRNSVNKGWLKGVPGAPMCGCVEHMPIVETATCRTATRTGEITYTFSYDAEAEEVSADNQATITYEDCANTDLAGQFKDNHATDAETAAKIDAHLVGAGGCGADLDTYLNDAEFLKEGVHETRYILPDPAKWSAQVIGEGIHFLPPDINEVAGDNEFRDLINAGCTTDDGAPRSCIIRRMCSSCNSEPHRDIFYKRLTQLPSNEVYFLDMFMNQWKSANNTMGADGDFQLFSSYEDALAGENAWEYCNYNHGGVGFPRDCGPKGYVGSQWNSYTVHSHGMANHNAYYVELP